MKFIYSMVHAGNILQVLVLIGQTIYVAVGYHGLK